jgi:hypothetical protein
MPMVTSSCGESLNEAMNLEAQGGSGEEYGSCVRESDGRRDSRAISGANRFRELGRA